MTVEHTSVDKGKDGADLFLPQPYGSHVYQAEKHVWDAYHGGPVCASYSAVRFLPGGPAPVRNAHYPLGFPNNTAAQQAEADAGTEMANRSAHIADKVLTSAKEREVEGIAAIEDPAPREDEPSFPSIFEMPEMKRWRERWGTDTAAYHLCAYGSIHFKPAWWVGVLGSLSSLNRTCTCPKGSHVPCRGKPEQPQPQSIQLLSAMLTHHLFWMHGTESRRRNGQP